VLLPDQFTECLGTPFACGNLEFHKIILEDGNEPSETVGNLANKVDSKNDAFGLLKSPTPYFKGS
jgi:hypothetical protein